MDVGAIIGIATGGIGLLAAAYAGLKKLAAIDIKVNTLWDFMMQGAMSEVKVKKLAVRNSPLLIDPKVRKHFAEFEVELKSFYRRSGRKLSERDLFFEIQRRFGCRIAEKINSELGLISGGGITIAMEIAKEPDHGKKGIPQKPKAQESMGGAGAMEGV